MKKKYRIIFVLFFFIIIIIIIAGKVIANNRMGTESNAIDTPSAVDWYIDSIAYSYSDYGIFYQSDNYVHFCDPRSGIDTIICDRVDCQHNKETCSAYVDGTAYIVMEGEKLIYLSNEDATVFGQQGLYEADVNGSNRRKLASFEEIQTITGVIFTDEWLFIAYYNQYDENMEALDADMAAVYAYNRITGEGGILWSDTKVNARIMNGGLCDNLLYVTYIYYDLTAEEILAHADDSSYMSNHFFSELCVLSMDGELISIAEDIDTACVSKPGIFYTLFSSDGDSDEDSTDNSFSSGVRELYFYQPQSNLSQIVGERLFAIPSFAGNLSFMRSYGNGQSLYSYDTESGEMKMLNSLLEDSIPVVFFEEYAYVRDYSENDGNGELKYISLSDVEKGEYSLHSFSVE